MAAIQDFFLHGRLYLTVNCALVTLIPKSPAAKTVKDIRPIACCTTLYKIISEILTSRMNKVINVVVHDSQSAFLPGKVIHDNILIMSYLKSMVGNICLLDVPFKWIYRRLMI